MVAGVADGGFPPPNPRALRGEYLEKSNGRGKKAWIALSEILPPEASDAATCAAFRGCVPLRPLAVRRGAGDSSLMMIPTADTLATAAKAARGEKGLPPVHLWNPPFCGDIDIRIARDGTWYYLGTPIGRAPLVKLFSGILKLEDGKYFLVTPVEKVGIRVDDAPFLATDFDAEGTGRDQRLTFHTRTEDKALAGPDHPIRVVRGGDGGPSPYVLIRSDLWALIDRKSFYRLVELGCHEPHEGDSWFGLWSGGTFFPVIPSAELSA
jgi:uncharacterized protein